MKKNKGSGLLIMAILASVITTLIGISLAKVHNLSLSSLQSNKLNLQAQAYAESEIKYLNCLEFNQINVPRGYGTGDIQVCVPCPKGATWQITGKCSWAYWMPLK